MTIIGSIVCNRCSRRADVSPSGGYPNDWGALTFKRVEGSGFKDKRSWQHVCPSCSHDLQEFLAAGIPEDDYRFKALKVETGE